MAVPPGRTIAQTYSHPGGTPVAAWRPTGLGVGNAPAPAGHALGPAGWGVPTVTRNPPAPPAAGAPAQGRRGGRSRRRKTSRRRGGALTKPLPELLMDLQRDPSKATLENVISDFKSSGIRVLEERGQRIEDQLRGGASVEYLIEVAARAIEGILNVGGDNEIPFRRRGGRRRKTTRRR